MAPGVAAAEPPLASITCCCTTCQVSVCALPGDEPDPDTDAAGAAGTPDDEYVRPLVSDDIVTTDERLSRVLERYG